MNNLFEIKQSKLESNKTIILGYAPSLITENTFFFSPLRLEHTQQINYEVGTEEGVIALICNALYPKQCDIDLGYLSAESNVGEEELEELLEFIDNQSFNLVLTQDFLIHPHFSQILGWVQKIATHSKAKCFFQYSIPAQEIELPEYNGLVARIEFGDDTLIGSPQFAKLAKLQDGDFITVAYQTHQAQVKFKLDIQMKGTIGVLQVNQDFFSYPYQKLNIIERN